MSQQYDVELYSVKNHRTFRFEVRDETDLWMQVGDSLVKFSRESEERTAMGVLFKVTGDCNSSVVCSNENISAGFNVLLQEISRLRKKLNRKSRNRKR